MQSEFLDAAVELVIKVVEKFQRGNGRNVRVWLRVFAEVGATIIDLDYAFNPDNFGGDLRTKVVEFWADASFDASGNERFINSELMTPFQSEVAKSPSSSKKFAYFLTAGFELKTDAPNPEIDYAYAEWLSGITENTDSLLIIPVGQRACMSPGKFNQTCSLLTIVTSLAFSFKHSLIIPSFRSILPFLTLPRNLAITNSLTLLTFPSFRFTLLYLPRQSCHHQRDDVGL
jgi:hypothetical protein